MQLSSPEIKRISHITPSPLPPPTEKKEKRKKRKKILIFQEGTF